MPNEIEDAALAYARAGLSVIPCEPRGNRPLVKWARYQTERASEQEIRQWWQQWPDANVAIVTGRLSGFVVADVDPRNGGSVEHLPPTDLVARSGGGGWHCYYAHPGGSEVVRTIARAGAKHGEIAGIDTKGDGGYVLAPPSIHKSGNRYTWTATSGRASPWREIAPAATLERGQIEDPAMRWVATLLQQGLVEGSRNDAIARLAGYFAGKNIPRDIAEAIIMQVNARSPVPLEPEEAAKTVRSAYATARRAKASGAGKHASEGFDLVPLREYMARYEDQQDAWIVRDWVPSAEVGMIASVPGGYKTWLAADLAVSVASGLPFLGAAEVERPGPVIFANLEDPHNLVSRRVTAIMVQRFNPVLDVFDEGTESEEYALSGLPDIPIYFHTNATLTLGDQGESMAALRAAVEKMRPRLLVIDPMYALVASLDNYMADAVKKLRPFKDWREAYGLSTVLVHHKRKSAGQNGDNFSRLDAWGSQLLNAFLGFGWQIARVDPRPNVISLSRHFKTAPAGKILDLAFDIEMEKSPWRYSVAVSDHGMPEHHAKDIGSMTAQLLEASLRALTPEEIAATLDVAEKDVRKTLASLMRSGLVVSDRYLAGAYAWIGLTRESDAPQSNDATLDEISILDDDEVLALALAESGLSNE